MKIPNIQLKELKTVASADVVASGIVVFPNKSGGTICLFKPCVTLIKMKQ
jgi:hypothetical protein